MLVLRRKEGQWVEITHRSGETIRVRVYNIRARYPGQLDMAFDDSARNFQVQRPERGVSHHSEVIEPLALSFQESGTVGIGKSESLP